jgi:hypothetical protein
LSSDTSLRTRRLGEVRVGEELPEQAIDVTASLIVAGALASRDFQDVHHDHAAAVANGAKDIFMSIHTTQGLIGSYIGKWAGPEAIFKTMSVRLGVPNYPGDVMVLTGQVTSADQAGSEGLVEISVRGANDLGDHVTGKVVVALPVEAS